MPDDWWFENTRLAQEFAYNVLLDKEKSKIVWSPALPESNDDQIGSARGTSYIWAKTMTEFTEHMNGRHPMIKYKNDKDQEGTEVKESVVFIPVLSGWRHFSCCQLTGLIPYILAHTTTKWWNHALQVQLCCRAEKDTEKCPDLNLTLSAIPKSSTVVINGFYRNICLVIVDDRGPLKSSFDLSPNFKIGPRGNNDFARLAHAWLGRIPNPKPYLIGTSQHIKMPFNFMSRQVVRSADTFKRTFSIVAELSTSFFMGWSVLPKDEENAPDPDVKSIAGPYVFNRKQPLKVSQNLVDICDLAVEERRNIIDGFNSWRVSPLGFLQTCDADVGDSSRPMLRNSVSGAGSYEYAVTETSNVQRILNLCGVYEIDRSGDWEFFDADQINRQISGVSMALAGISNINLLLRYLPIVDLNRISDYHQSVHPGHFSWHEKVTQGFRLEVWPHQSRRRLEQKKWMESIERTIGLNQTDINCWYSLPLPWWLLNKYIKQLTCTEYSNDLERIPHYNDPRKFGYFLTEGNHPFDLSNMAASRSYECDLEGKSPALFLIKTPGQNLKGCQVNKIGWNAWRLADYSRQHQGQTYNRMAEGVVELGAIVMPIARKYRCADSYARSEAYVSGMNRQMSEQELMFLQSFTLPFLQNESPKPSFPLTKSGTKEL
jgi:hypothetical protein